jgi:hypothetical protein
VGTLLFPKRLGWDQRPEAPTEDRTMGITSDAVAQITIRPVVVGVPKAIRTLRQLDSETTLLTTSPIPTTMSTMPTASINRLAVWSL